MNIKQPCQPVPNYVYIVATTTTNRTRALTGALDSEAVVAAVSKLEQHLLRYSTTSPGPSATVSQILARALENDQTLIQFGLSAEFSAILANAPELARPRTFILGVVAYRQLLTVFHRRNRRLEIEEALHKCRCVSEGTSSHNNLRYPHGALSRYRRPSGVQLGPTVIGLSITP